MLPDELWKPSCKPSSFPVENIKRGNQGITISFYYLIQNINVDGLIRYFCRISTILMWCIPCKTGERLYEHCLYPSF